jgi:hypothetical protein
MGNPAGLTTRPWSSTPLRHRAAQVWCSASLLGLWGSWLGAYGRAVDSGFVGEDHGLDPVAKLATAVADASAYLAMWIMVPNEARQAVSARPRMGH